MDEYDPEATTIAARVVTAHSREDVHTAVAEEFARCFEVGTAPSEALSMLAEEIWAVPEERRAEVTDPAIVMEAAAAFLAVRPRSVSETQRRMRHLGYPHALVDTVLERLVEMGYLDDGAFATAWVESRDRARPRGESALRRELSLKGIDREIVAAVLEERATTELDPEAPSPDLVAAARLLDRKRSSLVREPDPRKRRQKAYALLARNGFGPDVCRDVAATIDRTDEMPGETDEMPADD